MNDAVASRCNTTSLRTCPASRTVSHRHAQDRDQRRRATVSHRHERSRSSRRLASVQRPDLTRAFQLWRLGRHSLVVTSQLVEPSPDLYVLHAIGNVTTLLRPLLKQRLSWIPVTHHFLPATPSSRMMESSSEDNALQAPAEQFCSNADDRLGLCGRVCRIPRMHVPGRTTRPRRSATFVQTLGPDMREPALRRQSDEPKQSATQRAKNIARRRSSAAGGLFG